MLKRVRSTGDLPVHLPKTKIARCYSGDVSSARILHPDLPPRSVALRPATMAPAAAWPQNAMSALTPPVPHRSAAAPAALAAERKLQPTVKSPGPKYVRPSSGAQTAAPIMAVLLGAWDAVYSLAGTQRSRTSRVAHISLPDLDEAPTPSVLATAARAGAYLCTAATYIVAAHAVAGPAGGLVAVAMWAAVHLCPPRQARLPMFAENHMCWADPNTFTNLAAYGRWYADVMAKPGRYAGELEARALVQALKVRIGIWDTDWASGQYRLRVLLGEEGDTLHILNESNVHWSALLMHEPVQQTYDVMRSHTQATYLNVPGDGNCFFHAVARGLAEMPGRVHPQAFELRALAAATLAQSEELCESVYVDAQVAREMYIAWDPSRLSDLERARTAYLARHGRSNG